MALVGVGPTPVELEDPLGDVVEEVPVVGDRGRAYPYEGNYSTYLETKAARLKVEGAKDAKRQKRLKEELEWVRSGAKARQAKSKARLARYEEMAAEADKYRKLDFEEIQIPPGKLLFLFVLLRVLVLMGLG